MSTNDVTARSLSGFKYLVSLQLATRVATFGLNTAVLRYVDPHVFGAASQLQMITNITLFISRESIRRTTARIDSKDKDLSLLPWLAVFPLGVIATCIVGWLWIWGASLEVWNLAVESSTKLKFVLPR
jgi:O-antigen/teichoic acid export membrane protein